MLQIVHLLKGAFLAACVGKVGDSKNWFSDSQASLVEMAYHRELGENRHKLNYVTRQRTSQ